jgi:hypothetical protein
MTRHFGQGKLEEPERQAILEEVYQRAKEAATAAVKAVIEALLEAEVTAKLGREKGAVRHISGQPANGLGQHPGAARADAGMSAVRS